MVMLALEVKASPGGFGAEVTGGYDGHARVMHRTTVAGEAPRAASLEAAA
jgi:hypothetical protein